MEIIEYQPEYRQDFINFNTAWVIDNFGFLDGVQNVEQRKHQHDSSKEKKNW